MKRIEASYDLVVIGGGLAGVCAAIAGARNGLSTCLIHERPVLGGVASSEMRVTVHGAACHHAYARETGIIGEMLNEERARNHETINENGWTNSVFDQVLYDWCEREPNLTLHLNTPVNEVVMDGGEAVEVPPNTDHGYYHRPACNTSRRIAAVIARTQSAETELRISGGTFVDATGDAIVADRAGCEWRMGCESHEEFGDIHGTVTASTDTMGNSIHIRAKDIGRPAPFTPPDWAVHHDDASYFYDQGRRPTDPRGGYWWIEIGVPWHTIYDNETIRHELTRHALGVWDWMKNKDPTMKEVCKHYALDFIGQVPGKRESRRIVGRHWIIEQELWRREAYPDVIAHGGWFLDLHTAGGLLADSSEPAAAEGYRQDSEYAAQSYIGPYGIPLRALMAKDVDNLFLAGRCLSTSRAALGTLRVMGTTALMGQAVGTCAGLMRERGLDLPAMAEEAAAGGETMRALQQRLLRDGVFLPGIPAADEADLARQATVSASSTARFHGQSPDDPYQRNGQMWGGNRDQTACLDRMQAQVLYLAGGRLDSVSICCSNDDAAVDTPIRLVRIDGIWDYRKGGAAVVAEGLLTIPTGSRTWLDWSCALSDLPDGSYRLEVGPVETSARWHLVHAAQPGFTGQYHLSPKSLRDRHWGMAVRLLPAQDCYAPAQVLSGVCRPQEQTHCWRSDPGCGLPAWLQLDWADEQRISTVELSFAGHLLAEVHAEPAFFRDAQTARDYLIQVATDDGWQTVVSVCDNYHRQAKHQLPNPVSTKRLRLVVTATNGDPAACVYELRCY